MRHAAPASRRFRRRSFVAFALAALLGPFADRSAGESAPAYAAPQLPPLYHPRGQDCWDFWFVEDKGLYHSFYLQSPVDSFPRFYAPTVGVATSSDLLRWEEHGEVLRKRPRGQWNDAWIATGSVWRQNDRWQMVFTGSSFTGFTGVGLARSDDLLHWERVGEALRLGIGPFVVPRSSYWQSRGFPADTALYYTVIADPYVVPEPVDGWYYMVANSILFSYPVESRGCISMWRSRNTENWEPIGLIAMARIAEMEAPQIWKHGDRWYLMSGTASFSPRTQATMVFSSPELTGPYELVPRPELKLPRHTGWFYVGKVLRGPDGQDVLIGGVGGRMSRPYPVIYEPDGSITLAYFDPVAAQWVPEGISTATGPLVADASGGVIVNAARRVNANGYEVWNLPGAPSSDVVSSDASGGAIGVASRSGDVWAVRTTSTGSAAWGAQGIAVCSAPGSQILPAVTSDGSGGAFIAWMDLRGTLDYDIYAQHLDANGTPRWGAQGNAVCTAPGLQGQPAIAADGAGGVYIVWEDLRPGVVGNSDLYAQHVDATGAGRWAQGGIALASSPGEQKAPVMAADGMGGAYAAWWDDSAAPGDRDIHIQRIRADDTFKWPTGGVKLAGGRTDQILPALVPDGEGGVFVAWEDHRAGGESGLDIFAQHVSDAGSFLWRLNGQPVCEELTIQSRPTIALDGVGGVLVGWIERNEGIPGSLAWWAAAQRLDHDGVQQWPIGGVRAELITRLTSSHLATIAADGQGGAYIAGLGGLQRILGDGRPAWVPNFTPTVERIEDVPGDEGGYVRLTVRPPFSQTVGLSPAISRYSLWRRITRAADGSAPAPPNGWELVLSTQPLPGATFTLLAPTRVDSSAVDPGDETYSVVAQTSSPALFLPGEPVVGRSHDDLPPGRLDDAIGTLPAPDRARLTWRPTPARDLWHYNVYKGASADFAPVAGNRIGEPVAPEWEDDAFDRAQPYYKITALDRHGNESEPVLVTDAEWIRSPSNAPAVSFLSRLVPNPVRSLATMDYGLASDGNYALVVFDLLGRRVRTLADGTRKAGVWRVEWDRRDDNGLRLASGIYIVRLSGVGIDQSRKIVLAE